MTRMSMTCLLGVLALAASLGCRTTPTPDEIAARPPAAAAPEGGDAVNNASLGDASLAAGPSSRRVAARPVAFAQEPVPRPDAPPGSELPPPGQQQSRPPRRPEASPQERKRALLLDIEPEQADAPSEALRLTQVAESVVRYFPLIQATQREAIIAAGKQTSAAGAFDVKLAGESMNLPQGFYKNYRHLVKAEQPTWMGGAVYGQYRIGDGFFPDWYGERVTNEGGEFKIGAATPLLQNRSIDPRRAEIAKADLQRLAVDPAVQLEMIEAVATASFVYWSWVAAGQAYMVTQELLEVARERNVAIARQVETGDKALTELQQNERLIATREAKLIEARKKLQSAAIKLSLFLRDEEGQPILPQLSQLPDSFPPAAQPDPEQIENDIEFALQSRPELRSIALERETVGVDLEQAQNETLPRLDAVLEASKDVGAASSPKGDKTPLELEAGLMLDVPLQRRKAMGKVQSAQGKLSQLAVKQRFTEDKIATEVRDAVIALNTSYQRIERTRESVDLAKKLVDAEYRSFELGNSDVLRIALQEGLELESQLLEIEALLDYFQAAAAYRAALGQWQTP